MLFVTLALVSVGGAYAVGPVLPEIPKYSGFEVRGQITTAYDIAVTGGSCATGYEETIVKIYVSDDVGTVAVRFPEGMEVPSYPVCALVSGMLLPRCTGDDIPIAVVSNVSLDFTCN